MDIKQLRYFTEVADLSSFTRAAQALRVAQPALSRQVKLLEGELGLQLLHRNGRGVTLTAAGVELHGRSGRLVAEFAALRRDMIRRARSETGSNLFTIGLPASISPVLAPLLSARVKLRLPEVAVRVVAGHSGLLPDWVISGGIDLAILFGDPHNSHVVCQAIGTEDIFAVTAPGTALAGRSQVTAAELARLPLVMGQRPNPMWETLDRAGIRVGRHVGADTIAETVKLVRDGVGVGLLSLAAVAQEVAEQRLCAVPIRRPQLRRPILLCHPAGHKGNALARRVVGLLKTEIRALMRNGQWPASAASVVRG